VTGSLGDCGLTSQLALRGALDCAEDVGDLALEGGEVEIDHAALWMEHDIDWRREKRKLAAHGCAQTPLDAIAIDGLSECLAHGKANARSFGIGIHGGTGRAGWFAQAEEIAGLTGELFAAGFVYQLIFGVLAQSMNGGDHLDSWASGFLGSSSARLVAEAGADGDLVASLGTPAIEHGCARLGLHPGEEPVGLGAVAAIGLEGTLRHLTGLLQQISAAASVLQYSER